MRKILLYKSIIKGLPFAVLFTCNISCTIEKTAIGRGDGEGTGGNSGSGGMLTIAALKAMYINRPVTINEEITVQGRVISSDRWGNFYKTIYIEDDTGGIPIRIDLDEYFKTFGHGEQVTVYCNTLTLGTYGGAVQLGVLSGDGTNTVTHIPTGYVLSVFRIVEQGSEPSFRTVKINELTARDISTYVEITDVQFEEGEDRLTWCDGETDTNRTLIDREGNRLVVRTSGYATFAGEILPGGSGFVRGVVGYFNGAYQIILINQNYAVMESERFQDGPEPSS